MRSMLNHNRLLHTYVIFGGWHLLNMVLLQVEELFLFYFVRRFIRIIHEYISNGDIMISYI